MKTAIIYHEIKKNISCPDGIASAWVAKKKYPDAKLIGASYGDEVPSIVESVENLQTGEIETHGLYDRVIVVDFSFPIDILNLWQKAGIEVMVIDHHKTAMADLAQFSNAVFDLSESGATLTWKTFFPCDPMPAFLDYVRDRDLWNFDLPLSEEIHEAMSFIGRDLWKFDRIAEMSIPQLQEALGSLGKALLKPKRKRIAEIGESAYLTTVSIDRDGRV